MVGIKGDALFALALFGLFSFGTYQSRVMNNPSGGPTDVGAAFFPFWVCVFVQVLCAVVFVQSVLKARRETPAAETADTLPFARRAVLFVGILLLLFCYILIMDTVGFVAASALFLIAVHQLLVFSGTGCLSPPKSLGISVAFFVAVAGILYFLFNTVFRLALP